VLSSTFLDEDGLYDPASFNDRLLLGLKGELSQAELHFLKARMRGGVLNKARRGELDMGPPVGLIYLSDGSIGLDPYREVRSTIQLVFDTPALIKENCCGASLTIAESSRFCTTRVTRAPSSTAALVAAANRMASTLRSKYHGRSGSF
jgi:DNA invertase Pin-like site-specific DNA recombinase